MGKHELSSFIHRVCTAALTLHENSPTVKMSHMQRVESKAGQVRSWVKVMKVQVTLGKAAHAVFLPISNITDTISHPENAWKRGSAWQC